MLVKMLKPWATEDFNYAVGTVVEVDTDIARGLVDRGEAEAHEAFPAVSLDDSAIPPALKRGRKPRPIVVLDSTPDAEATVRTPDHSPAPPVTFVQVPGADPAPGTPAEVI